MQFHRHNLRVLLFALGLLGSLTACESPTRSVGTEPSAFCLIAQPIIFDRLRDTEETIAQVKEHNAVGVKLCGWAGSP